MESEKTFKYATEACVNLWLESFLLCQQDDLKYYEDDEIFTLCNIYFICQRNRIELEPNSMEISKDSLCFEFNIHEENKTFEVPACYPNVLESKDIFLESEYPHNFFILKNEFDDRLLVKSYTILDEARNSILPHPTFLDLEILYVGETKRDSILDRIENHKTFQKIYSEKKPDKDIYIFMCRFLADGFVEMKGSVKSQKEYEEEDVKRLEEFITNRLELSSKQQIDLAEACLIRYFEPKYNIEYKKSFPSTSHTKYNECYKLDLNFVSIEMNSDNLFFFSEEIKSSNKHYRKYYLTTDEERRKLFNE